MVPTNPAARSAPDPSAGVPPLAPMAFGGWVCPWHRPCLTKCDVPVVPWRLGQHYGHTLWQAQPFSQTGALRRVVASAPECATAHRSADAGGWFGATFTIGARAHSVLSFSAGSRGVDRPSGAVAQLVAHLVRNEGVRGSSPLSSTAAVLLQPPSKETGRSRTSRVPRVGQRYSVRVARMPCMSCPTGVSSKLSMAETVALTCAARARGPHPSNTPHH
jgi:hypothetical protein